MIFNLKSKFKIRTNLGANLGVKNEAEHGLFYLNYDAGLMQELIIGCFDELGYISSTFLRHAYTKTERISGKNTCSRRFLKEFATYFGWQVFYVEHNHGGKEIAYAVDESAVPEEVAIPMKTMIRLNVPNTSLDP